MFAFLVLALLFLVIAFVAGWLLVVWLMVKHPILGIPIAVYIGLVVWLGAHDAQALAIYALIVLAIWRLVHKRSFHFHQLVSRRLQSSRRLWAYDRPPTRDHGTVGPGEAPPAAPTCPEDPADRIRTVA